MRQTCPVTGCGKPLRSTNTTGFCYGHRTETSRIPARVCGVTSCGTRLLASNTLGWCRQHIDPAKREVPRYCEEPRCGKRIRSDNRSGWCTPHHHTHMAAENSARYHARKIGLFVEEVNRDLVLAAHGRVCHICAGVLDLAWDLDHVIPLTAGGPHCYDNAAPAHPSCNRSKSNRWVGSPDAAVDKAARAAYEAFHGRAYA
jgi:5-methylcytosine-specific restriction endonuclease McrA